MKTDIDKYIVVRCPNNNLGRVINIIHIVITIRQLDSFINKYFEGKIELDKELPVPTALFNYIAKRRRNYIFIDAVNRAKQLNKQRYGRRKNN